MSKAWCDFEFGDVKDSLSCLSAKRFSKTGTARYAYKEIHAWILVKLKEV
ncbi:hypothetical protein [Undibacterium sp. TJN19]